MRLRHAKTQLGHFIILVCTTLLTYNLQQEEKNRGAVFRHFIQSTIETQFWLIGIQNHGPISA